MIKIIKETDLDTTRFIHECRDCGTAFTYHDSDTFAYRAKPPFISCPACDDVCYVSFIPFSDDMCVRPEYKIERVLSLPEIGEPNTVYICQLGIMNRFDTSTMAVWKNNNWVHLEKYINEVSNEELQDLLM